MEVKLFEIRDRATFIPAMAIKLGSRSEEESYLLGRAGFGQNKEANNRYIYLTRLSGGTKATTDPHEWNNGTRTMHEAHKYIIKHFNRLTTGDVICVETILGERDTPKVSERLENRY